jgi:polyhydroxyalkanoate synthesis regulator protein
MSEVQPALIKRYAGDRLYDTIAARYVTVDELRQRKARGIPFYIRDAETGADIARVLLA